MASTYPGSAVDAQMLIWGVKRQASENRKDMIPRAAAFFRDCASRKIKLVIPAQSLAETLVGCDEELSSQILAKVGKAFIIAPFDGKAAIIAAKIQDNRNIIASLVGEKQKMKADISVVASAVAFGATQLYSNDSDVHKLGRGLIIVRELPEIKAIETQIPLPGMDES